jgi:hypothetical protein
MPFWVTKKLQSPLDSGGVKWWSKKVNHNLTHLHYPMVIEFFQLLGNRAMLHGFGRVLQKDATN